MTPAAMSLTNAADAVVGRLQSLSPGQSFSTVRAYYPVRDRDQLSQLTVTVMPRGIERTMNARGLEQVDYLVDIGVQKKLDGADDDAQVAAMASVVEQVAGHVAAREYLGGAASAVESRIETLMSEEHMTSMRVYTGIVNVRLRSWAQ
jgi:hypothetical protein